MRSFDIDGVIYLGDDKNVGLRPAEDDIIVTGRSFEEARETLNWLKSVGIRNQVFFSPHTYNEKTRGRSGIHKFNILESFTSLTTPIIHYEDDLEQKAVIEAMVDGSDIQIPIKVIHVNTNGMVNLENNRPHKGYFHD